MIKKRILATIILAAFILVVSYLIFLFINNTDKSEKTDLTNPATTAMPTATIPANTSPPKIVKISATGDILLGRGVAYHIKENGGSYTYPFQEVRGTLKYGDVIFGNLEEPFTSSENSLWGKIILKSEPKAIEGIKYAGFNLLSLANNHIIDYYTKGLYDTMDLLDKNNIVYAGAGKNLENARKLAIIEKNGVKIGLLAYTEMAYEYYTGNPSIRFVAEKNSGGVAPNEIDYIKEDIKNARSKVDILIVSLHFGVEYTTQPQDKQVKEAHTIIDSGADIIIGHHTHLDQGIEIYKGKPIFYSLGNFIFDQNEPLNQRSFIINMEMTGNKLTALSAVPVQTIDKRRLIKATGSTAKEMIENEKNLSLKLNSDCEFYKNTLKFNL